MRELRPYQTESLNSLRRNISCGILAQMLQLATGGGKTQIASAVMAGAASKGKRAYFVVDSLELVDQAAERFRGDGMRVGIIQGQHEDTDYSRPIQVATIQTLRNRWGRIASWLKPDVVVIDEAHVLYSAHEEIIAECKRQRVPVIGLSATPFRKGLGKHFEALVVGATTSGLTSQGYLVPATCYAPFIPNLEGIKTKANGDWQEDALAEYMGDASIVGDVIDHWFKLGEDRQTLVFAANVAHSRLLCDRFLAAGVKAAHVDGYDTDKVGRTAKINAFRSGEIKVLCNVGVLTKGFDAPETGCVVMARPTKSLMMHIQMIGRGLRTAPGKQDCLARGTRVLTDSGLVNIEDVTLDHKVWDGVQFVKHSGAVCRGVREVIQYNGLIATPDHRVMTNEGWKPFAEASARQLRITRTGIGRLPVRVTDDNFEEVGGLQLRPEGRGYVFELRRDTHGQVSQHEEASEHKRLSALQSKESDQGSEVAVSALPGAKGPLSKLIKSCVSALRRARNSVQIREPKRCCSVGRGESWYSEGQDSADRQDRQFRALRARKSSVGAPCCESEQYASVEGTGEVLGVQAEAPINQICGLNSDATNSQGIDGRRDNRALEYPIMQTEREVWDILNAGPLQRFTANGRLVHNCIIIDHAGNCLRNGLPTDELPAELDDGHNPRNLDRKQREKSEPVSKACMSCGYVTTKHVCPACGFKPERRQDVEVVDGELYEITKTEKKEMPAPELADLYAEMLGYGLARGYSPGWAWHKCKEYAGRAPRATKQIAPCQPSQRTLSIIKHLQIRAAKKRAA